jgi:uncharacterized membrane protein YphA (DoxX/SURF4 family)
MLIPYGAEIWSNQGLMPDPSLNFTYGVFPNILNWFDAPLHITIFLYLLTFLSVLFVFGFQRPIVSVLLWYGWACLFNRNNLISNPGIPFVGWLLLACAVIPKGEPYSFGQKSNWKFPELVWLGAWLILGISYTISGIDKLQSPSWADGTAIHHLLDNPLARNWFLREWMLTFPEWIIKFFTWSVLAIEILFGPLCLLGLQGRKWAWLSMTLVHLGILMIVDFADLTSGMLMIHVLTFDRRWVGRMSI